MKQKTTLHGVKAFTGSNDLWHKFYASFNFYFIIQLIFFCCTFFLSYILCSKFSKNKIISHILKDNTNRASIHMLMITRRPCQFEFGQSASIFQNNEYDEVTKEDHRHRAVFCNCQSSASLC